jgi:ABC-type phosphate transport system substrate-binding protein
MQQLAARATRCRLGPEPNSTSPARSGMSYQGLTQMRARSKMASDQHGWHYRANQHFVSCLGAAVLLLLIPQQALAVTQSASRTTDSARIMRLRGAGASDLVSLIHNLVPGSAVRFRMEQESLRRAIEGFQTHRFAFVEAQSASGVPKSGLQSSRSYAVAPFAGDSVCMDYDFGAHDWPVLHLDDTTVLKILSGQITEWNSRSLVALNPKLSLPHMRIRVYYRTDRSEDTYVLASYLSTEVPSAWTHYNRALGYSPRPTTLWPAMSGSRVGPYNFKSFEPQRGPDNASSAVAARVGSVTFVPTSYAIEHGDRCASLRNVAGYDTEPSSHSVAAALSAVRPTLAGRSNLLLTFQNANVSAYPLADFESLIVPTQSLSTRRGALLSTLLNESVCGVWNARSLGLSPVRGALRRAARLALSRIPGARSWSGCSG